jgi:hypothetical protein
MNAPPLSNNDISRKLEKYGLDVEFVPYKQLKYLTSLDEIIPCFLLYQQHYPIGHWVALFKNQEGMNYFDPTGKVPDILLETNYDHPAGRIAMNADFTYLNNLLYKSAEDGYKIIYNDVPLQTPDSNTCGYWTSVRLLTKDVKNDDFNKLFNSYSDDERQEKIVNIYKRL